MFCLLLGLLAPVGSQAAGMRHETVTLISSTGKTEIDAEIAATPHEQEQGLMFRRSLGDTAGMLFVYDRAQPLRMWMRNTYVSLDMIFIGPDGKILRIEANADPLSDRVISSGGNVAGVLELKAGAAVRLGLRPGDSVSAPSLKLVQN